MNYTATMTVEEIVAVKLNLLGNSPDEVAASLRAAGVKGQTGEASKCPVSNYLHQKLPEFGFSTFWTAAFYPWGQRDEVGLRSVGDLPIPTPVGRFIRAFDDHLYPDLEEGSL